MPRRPRRAADDVAGRGGRSHPACQPCPGVRIGGRIRTNSGPVRLTGSPNRSYDPCSKGSAPTVDRAPTPTDVLIGRRLKCRGYASRPRMIAGGHHEEWRPAEHRSASRGGEQRRRTGDQQRGPRVAAGDIGREIWDSTQSTWELLPMHLLLMFYGFVRPGNVTSRSGRTSRR